MKIVSKKQPKFYVTDNWHFRFLLIGKNFDERYEKQFLMTNQFFTQAEHASVKAELTKFAEQIIDKFLEDYYE